MTQHEQQQEALNRAQTNRSTMNYAPALEGFAEKGIPAGEIIPRENVLTFNAWKALGRSVRKGEHGVKVITWIVTKDADGNPDKKICRSTTVFHITQTDAV